MRSRENTSMTATTASPTLMGNATPVLNPQVAAPALRAKSGSSDSSGTQAGPRDAATRPGRLVTCGTPMRSVSSTNGRMPAVSACQWVSVAMPSTAEASWSWR